MPSKNTFTFVFLSLFIFSSIQVHAQSQSWRFVQELTVHDQINLSNNRSLTLQPSHSHRHPHILAEEMGLGVMEFLHTPLWNCLLIDIGTTVTADGFLDQQVAASAILALPRPSSPGQERFRWIAQSVNSSNPEETTIVQIGYYTGKSNDAALTTLFPRPGLTPLRLSILRGERLPRGIGTIDDVVGRNAGDFAWRILGSDILEQTIRFPANQKQLTVPDSEGRAVTISTQTVKMMGEGYPGSTAASAVPCYVVEAEPHPEALPNYYLSKLIYWLDQRSFFPLRIEQYDRTGKLTFITVRTATLANSKLKERGYAGFLELSWDLERDMMTSSIHTVIPKEWSEEERQLFFHPESVQWKWPLPALAQFPRLTDAQEFYLRPDLYRDKFPQDRKIVLSPELTQRIAAQEREGHLVFGQDIEKRETE